MKLQGHISPIVVKQSLLTNKNDNIHKSEAGTILVYFISENDTPPIKKINEFKVDPQSYGHPDLQGLG